MRTFNRLLSLCLLLLVGAGGVLLWQAHSFLETPAATPGVEGTVDVEPGSTVGKVTAQLERQGVITSARKFTWLARYKQWEGKLQAGRFAVHSGWKPLQVLEQLVLGQPVLHRITLREGLTWWQTAQTLAAAGFVRYEDFKAVIHDPDFLRHYGLPGRSAEGFLMPDTYLLKKSDTPGPAEARAIAGRLVDTFWRKTAHLWTERPRGAELQRIIVLASIVERETAIAAERPRVAGVYANRLQRGMPLQADPTVIYGLGLAFDGNLRRKHLEDKHNPYNTYQIPGLPPGPICSPGVKSIAAAVTPERHSFLYFVAITDGGEHAFSTNLAEHNRNVRRYLDNRRKK